MLDNLINWELTSLCFHMQNMYVPAHYIEQINTYITK